MRTPEEIIQAEAAARNIPVPLPPYYPCSPAFVAACIAMALIEARVEWQAETVPSQARGRAGAAAMRCPKCDSDNTRVIDSRPCSAGASIRRRRVCECGERFTTYEILRTTFLCEPPVPETIMRKLIEAVHAIEELQAAAEFQEPILDQPGRPSAMAVRKRLRETAKTAEQSAEGPT